MKFLNLKLTNINSWVGEHLIELDHILRNEGLFAITGPTGSGKSSILTALSLALYGRGPKKELNAHDYISLGQSEAKIELEAMIKGVKINAHWSIKHGQKTPQRKVLLDGELAAKPKTVLEEMIGLNFDQFSKTIILNQGEFARFLTSSFTERKEILEHLAGIDQLSNFIEKLKSKRNAILQEWDQNSKILEALPQIDIKQIEKIELDLSNLEEELKHITSLNQAMVQIESSIKSFLDFEHEEDKCKQRMLKVEENIKNILPELSQHKDELEKTKHKKQIIQEDDDNKRPLLLSALVLEKELQLLIQQKSSLQKESEKIENELNGLKVKGEKLNQQIIEFEKEIPHLKTPIHHTTNEEKQKIQNIANQYQLQEQRINNLNSDFSKKMAEKEEMITQVRKNEGQLKILQDQLSSFGQMSETEFDKEIERLQNVLNLKQNHVKSMNQRELNKQELIKSRMNLSAKREIAEMRFGQAELSVKENELQRAIGLVLAESQKKGECLICGGHELHQHSYEELTPLNESLNDLKSELDQYLIEMKAIDHQLLKIEEDESNSSGENLPILDEIIAQINEVKKQRSNLLSIEKQILPLNAEHNALVKNQESNEISISEISKELQHIHEKRSEIQKSFHLIIPALELTDTITEIPNWIRLENRRSELQQKLNSTQHSKQEVDTLVHKFTTNLTELKSKGNELSQQIKEGQSQLSSIVGNQKADILLKMLDQEKKDIETQIENHSKLLRDCEKKRDYEQSVLINEKFNLDEIKLKIVQSKTKIANEIKLGLQNFPKDFEGTRLLKLSEVSIEWSAQIVRELLNDVVSPWREKIQISNSDFIEKRGKLTSEREQLKKDFERREQFNKQHSKLQKEKETHDTLYQLMIKQDFRGFVLSFIEEALIDMANHELDQLCDSRYRLVQIKDDEKAQVEFQIIDAHHGGVTRKISTLSGGETFLVSLGLALALSNMMRGKTEIDSFFIDEGFGTLDPEAIDDVLNILINVEMRGKTIGLISHVKSLTDRIPVNLELIKSDLGTKFKVIYN